MLRVIKANWVAAACVLFVLVNAFFVADRFYWLNALPAVLLVVWAMLTAADRLLIFIAFATPLSINLEEMDLGGLGVALPTEPLMVGLMVLFLLKVALERGVLDEHVWRHPITWVVVAQLVWMAVCIVPSTMPLVSLKYLTARLWFVCTMYFLATRLFEEPRNMHRFIWAYIAGLVIVIGYTLVQHAQFGFAQEPAHWVMSPFFKDHTSYGAIIAFFIPFSVAALRMPGYTRTRKGIALAVFTVLLAGLIFSYTRAAWLSLVGAFGLFLVMRLKVPVWAFLLLLITGGGIYYANEEQITIYLESNREESSDDLGEHVQSISNISSDASNLERINRWHSALRMWQEKPVFGWGPGTYMFQYAPFQASEDRTIISTNFGVQG
ncbi:MAG: O-antigen ligase family protein, partial [Flavobacteriales bacterium]